MSTCCAFLLTQSTDEALALVSLVKLSPKPSTNFNDASWSLKSRSMLCPERRTMPAKNVSKLLRRPLEMSKISFSPSRLRMKTRRGVATRLMRSEEDWMSSMLRWRTLNGGR